MMATRPLHVRLAFIALCSIAVVASPAAAPDWPQWRGQGRDGVALNLAPPPAWPATLDRRWSVAVGEGHASPVLEGGEVFIHTRQGEEEIVRAIAIADGREIWRQAWPAPYTMHMAATGHGKGPKATPALSGGRLFVLGIEGTLTALDRSTGRRLWTRGFAGEFKTTSPLYGTSASPVVDGDRVIAFVGGHHDGALMAFDASTGRTIWSLRGDGPGYASPIVAELGGVRQVVTQSDQRVLGVRAEDGRLLWSLPFTTPYDQNAVTAVIHRGLAIVSGLEQGTAAWRLDPEGGAPGSLTPKASWIRKDLSLYLASPVVSGDRLFGFSPARRGHLFAVDLATGADLWHAEGTGAENASLTVASPWLLALTDGAELMIGRVDSAAWSLVARYTVAESPTWAHLVPAGDAILVKDRNGLSLLSWAAAAPPRKAAAPR